MCVMILIGSGSGYSQIRITAHSQSIKDDIILDVNNKKVMNPIQIK